MKYLFDTNIVSAFLAEEPFADSRIVERFAEDDEHATSVVTYGEIWYGLRWMVPGQRRREREAATNRFFRQLKLEFVTPSIAGNYAEIKAYLRRRGEMIPEADIWIAATAFTEGYVLVTRDAHFSRVPDLVVERW